MQASIFVDKVKIITEMRTEATLLGTPTGKSAGSLLTNWNHEVE